LSNFIVTNGLGGVLLLTEGWGGVYTVPEEPSNIITDHLERALKLFITEFRQTRIVEKTSRFALIVFDNDPAQGGIDIDTENPILDHLEKSLGLFITQFRQTRIL
jgi:hypothetical protein